ncbi:S-adenosylmethionine decarboxylase proenzyme [Spizellomyces punctatus DAOM BR117]|uniref:S-adenosylmethionine decarboxylase proenzyme n=1 Tax=Spizellomyces punctatus (strain DAOM BR117) TaxID=645134 RepID=A0A0L0HSC3_SPIPD|nr:S-adenosylmethionine decarboxylase proenzyme [Spizellomyces punctatus DAOM BR117]KND04256.1 S-adenosylmethionine decarboxylase proenzyme [Spizellomyces punctatus DAOM BR117]|eukprot:XP_016612295.1 S-adenosylmethionine decarboxylase proenzyme [Spizellomyces punctatus DAOM BR117]
MLFDGKFPPSQLPSPPRRRMSLGFGGSARGVMNLVMAINACLWVLLLVYVLSDKVMHGRSVSSQAGFHPQAGSVPVRLTGSWFPPRRPPVSCISQRPGEHLPLGKHYLVDMHNVNSAALELLETDAAFSKIAGYIHSAGMTLLGTSAHRFECGGMTAVFLLSESHVSIHTWPEHRFVALDVYTCGSGDPQRIVQEFENLLQPRRSVTTKVNRGADHHISTTSGEPINPKQSRPLRTRPALLDMGRQVQKEAPSKTLAPTQTKDHNATIFQQKEVNDHLVADICVNGDSSDDDCYLLREAVVLADERSPYQRVEIVDSQSFGRCMLLDRVVQFCESDNEVYTRQITERVFKPYFKGAAARLKNKHQAPDLVVQLVGGGDGWVSSHILDRYGDRVKHITAVDIDPLVTELTKEHFEPVGTSDAFTDSRVTWIYDDAGKWLATSGQSDSVDIFIIDCTDHTAEAAKILYTQEFYNNVYRMLKRGGRVVQQMNTDDPSYTEFFRQAESVWLAAGLKGLQKWSEYVPSFGGKSTFWMAQKY